MLFKNQIKIMKDSSKKFTGIFLIITISLVVASIVFSIANNAHGLWHYLVMPIAACLLFGKFILVIMLCRGWKAFDQRAVLGFPLKLFTLYLTAIIFLTLIPLFYSENTFLFPGTKEDFYIIIFDAFLALAASLVVWFYGLKDIVNEVEEEDVRAELRNQEFSEQEIEEKITALKNLNLV